VENQLSLRLISLSLLFTCHQNTLQRILVRSSIHFYINFNLHMNRSRSFGFYISFTLFSRPLQTRFRYAFFFSFFFWIMLAKNIHSLAHDAKGTLVSFYHFSTLEKSNRLLSILFQALFHSSIRCSFHFSLTVLFTIGYLFIFRLLDGSNFKSSLRKDFSFNKFFSFIRDYHRLRYSFSTIFNFF